jgi:hypothetical protein
LNSGPAPKSGYATSDQPDVVRTPDQSFRPIDVKLGPDGALYVSDWTNPVINHGEVDFRDPRRDKVSGRIWRISSKAGKPVVWKSLWEKDTPALLNALLSDNLWEQQQARKLLSQRVLAGSSDKLAAWQKDKASPAAALEAAYIRAASFGPEAALKGLVSNDVACIRAVARRLCDVIGCSKSESVKCMRGPGGSQGATHNNRKRRVGLPNVLNSFKSVHLGHFDVESYDIWLQSLYLLKR